MAARKAPAKKAPAKKRAPKPAPADIVAVAVDADERVRTEAVDLVLDAIRHSAKVLKSGTPDRQDKIAAIYTQQVVKSIVDRGPQGDSSVEEYHRLRREAGLGNLNTNDE